MTAGVPKMPKEYGDYGVDCLTCQYPGIPVGLDGRGFLVAHQGRLFPCRVPSQVAVAPSPGMTADQLAWWWREEMVRRGDPRACAQLEEEARAGQEAGERKFWEAFYEEVEKERAADPFAHESTSFFRDHAQAAGVSA